MIMVNQAGVCEDEICECWQVLIYLMKRAKHFMRTRWPDSKVNRASLSHFHIIRGVTSGKGSPCSIVHTAALPPS